MLIVLAEDNAELRQLLAVGLEHVGHVVVQAKTGGELIEQVARVAHEVALIVTDVRMPQLDGIAAIRCLRDAGITTPVIFMTAFGDAATRDEAHRLQSRWIDKPIGLNTLRAAVATALAAR